MAPSKQRLLAKWLFLVVVTAFLLGVTVFGFEFLFSPYRRLPINGMIDGNLYTWGHLVRNNKYGFRERDFESPKPANTYRVMVLGDSLTWGAGLAVEERYTAIAENLLNKAFPQKRFELLNFGISGGPTTKERDILQELKREVDPDLIVVGFCLNDPQPKRMDYSIEREKLTNSKLGQTVDKLSRLLVDASLPFTAKLLNDAFYQLAQKLRLIPDANTALGRAYDPLSNEWQSFVQALKDIKNTSDELNLSAPIFAILSQGSARNALWPHWFQQAEKAAADMEFVSYNHEFEIAHRLGGELLTINRLDGHPSAAVNRIYGEKLYQAISRQIATSYRTARELPSD